MTVRDPTTELPRRELEECALAGAFGLTWLELTVRRVAGVNKRTGEVRYRSLTTKYRVEHPAGAAGVVYLVKPDGTRYEVTAWACTCPDGDFKARERKCKHRTAVEQLGLLGEGR